MALVPGSVRYAGAFLYLTAESYTFDVDKSTVISYNLPAKGNIFEGSGTMGPDDVGQRIKRLREDRGLSQRQLAEMTDLNNATIARIEGGGRMPTRRTLRDLARALGVSVSELAGEQEGSDG